MAKWIIALIALIAGIFAWSHFSQKGSSQSGYLDYVPQDTIMLLQTKNTEQMMRFMESYPLINSTVTPLELVKTFFQGNKDGSQQIGKFFSSLSNSIFKDGHYTYGNLYQGLGVANDSSLTIYFHGAIPVIRVGLSDVANIEAALAKASKESGLAPKIITMGEASVQAWSLPKGNDPVTASVAVTTHDNTLTITLLTDLDTETDQKQRLGLASVENPISSTAKLSAIDKQYKFLNGYTGFIDINLIAQSIFNPESTRFGQDLLRFLAEDKKQKLLTIQDQNCKKEYGALFAAVPKMIFGYTKIDIANDKANLKGVAALEITNPDVTAALKSLNGHIPSHSQQAEKSLIGIGVGLNAQSFVSSLTNLHSQFIQAPFKCEALIKAQERAAQQSPMMLGMMFGMVQSLKGAGFSFFDISIDESMQPKSASAILSIATTDPKTIVSLTSMVPVPSLSSLVIPEDGTPVSVTLPGVPPSIDVKAAIKGNFVVIYTGPEGEAAANNLASESLEDSSLYGVALNYAKLGELMEKHSNVIASIPAQNCVQSQQMKHTFKQLDMSFAMQLSASDYGMPMTMDVSMNKFEKTDFKIDGKYNIDFLGEACQPSPIGTMTFNADGTGQEINSSTDSVCIVGQKDFSWKRSGDLIEINSTKNLERFDCSQPLKDALPTIETCAIINETAQSFQCVFDANTLDPYIVQATK